MQSQVFLSWLRHNISKLWMFSQTEHTNITKVYQHKMKISTLLELNPGLLRRENASTLMCRPKVDLLSDLHTNEPMWQYTEWFKINLTLSKTHVSHKWESVMNLFEHIYKAWYLGMMWWKWHQNWGWNTETRALFGQTVKKNFTHTQNQWDCSHRHVYKRHSCTDISIIDFAVCRMIPQYNTIPPRQGGSIEFVCM